MASLKKNTLCLKEKIELINCYEKNKLSVKELREKYKCGKTQIYYIIKRKHEYKEMWREGTRGDLKKKRRSENEEINNLVWEWFLETKSQNLPISGPILQSKARTFAEQLGNYSFKASNGWLESFRRRHSIVGNEVCEELKGINQECIDDWKKKIPSMIQHYKDEDIFSGAETLLFFRDLPSETVTVKEENSVGGKQSREGLTLFLCCSLKGEKETPLVIGKSAKPRCFENLCLSKLPVLWKSNKNAALMTADIMKEWLKSFDFKMQTQQRNVLLFLSNSIYNSKVDLKNVKLVFLPQNTISHTQPLYQGVIENLKTYYQKLCNQSIQTRMNTCENMNELSRSITVLDAILWISSSWNNIEESVIESCFKKALFPSDDDGVDAIIDDAFRTAKQLISETFSDSCDAYQCVDIDRDTSTAESSQSIDDPVINQNEQSDNSDLDEKDETIDENSKIKTYAEALKAINQIRDFSLLMNDGQLFNLMNDANNHVLNEITDATKKQKK